MLRSGGRGRTLGAALVAALGAALAGLAPGAAGASPIPLTVSGADVGPPVSAGFVGLATEYYDVEMEVGADPAKPDQAFERAVSSLAPYGGLSLRIGGDSADWTWWPIPGMKQPRWVRWTLTPDLVAVTKRLAEDLHANLILGINMEANSPRVTRTEVNGIESSIGSVVPVTFELGNEPELYSKYAFYFNKAGKAVAGRPKSYSIADMTSQWDQLADALPRVRLAGPGYPSLNLLSDAGEFLHDSPRVSLLTVHTYPLKATLCTGIKDLQESQLFEPSSLQTMADQLGTWTSLAHRHGVGIRVDEMNSVTCGGMPKFSGTLGPALWALNVLPLYAEKGVNGVNFQSRPNSAQNLIQTTHTHAGWRVTVQPEYYGLMAFAQLTPPGSRIATVSGMPAGLYAWAVRTPQRQTHVVVTNVTSAASAVTVRAPGASGAATVEVLKANSGELTASSGITLGGQRLSASTGQLTGPQVTTTVHASKGGYDVTVPPASAAIVTFEH